MHSISVEQILSLRPHGALSRLGGPWWQLLGGMGIRSPVTPLEPSLGDTYI